MHDEVAVGMFHGRAHVEKQTQALLDREVVDLTILRDPGALDVLHDDVRKAFLGRTAVEQTGDVWMMKIGQCLALAAEALEYELRVHSGGDELDGDINGVLLVVALGEINGAHAAASQLTHNPVRTGTAK